MGKVIHLNTKTSVPLFKVFSAIGIGLPLLISAAFYIFDGHEVAHAASDRVGAVEKHQRRIEKAVYRLEVHAGTLPKNYKPILDDGKDDE